MRPLDRPNRSRQLGRWVALPAILILVTALISSCGGTGKPRTRLAPARPLRPSSIYWGARIGSQLTGAQAPWSKVGIDRLAALTGKGLSLVHFEVPFASCTSGPCSLEMFPNTPLGTIRAQGAIPFLSWSSQSLPTRADEPAFGLGQVVGGRYDSYIRDFASAARRWGHPFFIRFDWDMNGTWAPWSATINGNQPGQYVQAWRHVWRIFRSMGADNVSWVWCPRVDPESTGQSLAPLYPGDRYVDWTCLDGYNFGTIPASSGGWMSFDQLFSASYREIVDRVAPSKPMMIGEVASSEKGGSKASWIAAMLGELATRYQQIRGMIWSDYYDAGDDWPIETSAAATSAFARGIQSPAYVASSYGRIAASPIGPPRP